MADSNPVHKAIKIDNLVDFEGNSDRIKENREPLYVQLSFDKKLKQYYINL